MKTIINKSIYVFISLILCLVFVSNPVLAARSNGEVILAKDLAVGEIVTVQIATGTNKDAMVVGLGECPRLVLLEDLGTNVQYITTTGVNLGYDTSNLKQVMDTRTIGHGNYIFNISAPFVHEIVSHTYNYNAIIDAGIIKTQNCFWTRTPVVSSYIFIAGGASIIGQDAYSNSFGVRPAFNLKSDTVLKYNSTTAKYTVTTTAEDLALAFFQANGFDTVIYVPQGQTPTGYTALSGYTGVFYKQINNRFLFVYAQEYTTPTSIGSLNIN